MINGLSTLKKLGGNIAFIVSATCIFALSGCMDITNTPSVHGSTDNGYEYIEVEEGTLEPLNRGLFAVHDVLDTVIIRPVAMAYKTVVPDTGRTIVTNILQNLSTPVDFVNSVLQGDVENSFASFWKFMLNSTFGMAGAIDFTGQSTDLVAREADFGQTLATYGATSGPYLFIPLIGPTTLRDGVGRGVDTLFRPVTWIEGDTWNYVEAAANGINFRAKNMKTLDDLYNNSLDPYAAYRSVYLQRRAKELQEAEINWSWQ